MIHVHSMIFLSLCFFYNIVQAAEYVNPVQYIVQDKKPTQSLLDLLAVQGVQHDGTLSEIVQATQQSWLRPAGKERWEIDDSQFIVHDQVWKLIDDLHLRVSINPVESHYNYVVLMGATAMRMQLRLKHFLEIAESGLEYDQFVVLVGQRPLTDTEKEFMQKEYNAGDLQTESEAACVIVNTLSDVIKNKMQFISVDMIEDGNGGMRRPTTVDVIQAWLGTHVKPGTCLAISNQPFVAYQHGVISSLLPKDFTLHTVGAASYSDVRIGVYLDSIARILYGNMNA